MSELDALREELIEANDDFRRLHEEHQECERRLEEINQQSFLTQEDELEEKRLKRHKLTLKDQMYELLRHHQASRVTV